jgi:hypothetical protein
MVAWPSTPQSEQVDRAVPHVLPVAAQRVAGCRQQIGNGASQRLDVGLFVQAHHQFATICQRRRPLVVPERRGRLGFKILGQRMTPIPHLMRVQVGVCQDVVDGRGVLEVAPELRSGPAGGPPGSTTQRPSAAAFPPATGADRRGGLHTAGLSFARRSSGAQSGCGRRAGTTRRRSAGPPRQNVGWPTGPRPRPRPIPWPLTVGATWPSPHISIGTGPGCWPLATGRCVLLPADHGCVPRFRPMNPN